MTVENARRYAVVRERLALPPLIRATREQYNEAASCTRDCRAFFVGPVRLVHAHPQCWFHR